MVLLLLFSMLLLAAGLTLLVKYWPLGWWYSFSQHAAQAKSATIYYAVLFTIVLILLNVFVFAWFIPSFQISIIFGLLFLLSSILQVACTLLPEKGRTIKIHRQLAGASALLLLPCLGLMYANGTDIGVRAVMLAGAITMIVSMLLLVLDKQKRVPFALQLLYYVGFFGPLLFVSFKI